MPLKSLFNHKPVYPHIVSFLHNITFEVEALMRIVYILTM